MFGRLISFRGIKRQMDTQHHGHKLVFFFGDGRAEGDASMKDLLGGKGANLAEMTNIGVPVPAGFTISTEVCTEYYANEKTFPTNLSWRVDAALGQVEKVMNANFGDVDNPLLLSVRSGARASMPGMMDTVLNLGLNDETIVGLIKKSGDERFAYDSYRRFVQMYGNVVMGVEHHAFEACLSEKKKELGLTNDTEITAAVLKELVADFKAIIKKETGNTFPEVPKDQLWGAIAAVFDSWMKDSAITYRRLHGFPEDWGTAVNVQSMVFGNMGDDCATGVCFTRDPATGQNRFYGEYLINAQGEDVVAGIRTPQQITLEGKKAMNSDLPAMAETMPGLYGELVRIYKRLEKHYREMQDMEFTIQQGKLWILQTRTGKRTARAALKIAVDMVGEGLVSKEEAVSRVDPSSLDQLLHPTLDPDADKQVLAVGLAASPGAATGKVVFTANDAESEANKGEAVVLVREETSPEDIHGMHAAKGIITSTGGTTSHAAVVARGMGRPCVSGCGALVIDSESGSFTAGGVTVKRGEWITLDGATGEVMLGKVPTREPSLTGDFAAFMTWVDEVRRLRVRTNADTPNDARVARKFGAEGIGLCRTEHMFFEGDRIIAVREMILAENEKGRRKALAKILPMQRSDFEGIFREMKGFPVTIRLLDPPLHEFIPHDEQGQKEVAKVLKKSIASVKARVDALHEFNPMLGHRGCRLGVTYPEIYEMQVRAIMEAACGLVKKEGFSITPEIMIPLVSNVTEFSFLKERCEAVCQKVMSESGIAISYMIGTMIELPRAALTADAIAQEAEFFSFGTNDLTQTTMGISRDDAGRFLTEYAEKKLISKDPFVSIDQEGVGQLVVMGADKGRQTNPDIKLGVCGEHGGDPDSIAFFEKVGLDYISCSPYRVPIARLAAAQVALSKKNQK
ncbi:MAG: pyruvate, phosphate dikinase [Magnetococcales bacterium]|nr:pyruvate, phosphate dikinase [Magnetococcales bacterium]